MQLKSSLISFNHHFDSPVIPTNAKELKTKGFQLLSLCPEVYSILARVTEIVMESVTKTVTYFLTSAMRHPVRACAC